MIKKSRLLLVFSFICFSATVFNRGYAQVPGKLISVSAKEVSFAEFIKQIETKSGLRFWYKDEEFSTFKITIDESNQTPEDIVLKAIGDSQVSVVIIGENGYIFRNRELQQTLPRGLFKESEPQPILSEKKIDISKYESKDYNKDDKTIVIGVPTRSDKVDAIISGNVANAVDGEAIVGATIISKSESKASVSDAFGNFSIQLKKGKHQLEIRSVGMKNMMVNILLLSDGTLNASMREEVTSLKEVVVESGRDAKVTSLQIGVEKLSIKTIKQISTALGEVDVMKAVLTLPGVQSVGEAANGVNVRGGSTNQNLILYNDAVVYNSNHLFGFFSSFNPDVVKSIELYKTGLTPDYGGRLSSVIEVIPKEGNLKKFSGAGGISPISGRLTLEGPLIKDKASFLIAGRSSYSNWLMNKVDYKDLQQSAASFYDLNIGFHFQPDANNSIELTGYQSSDHFKLRNDSVFSYGDKNLTLAWRHRFNARLYSKTNVSYNEYENKIVSEANQTQAFQWKTGISQYNFKTTFDFAANQRLNLMGGTSLIYYKLSPGSIQPQGAGSQVTADQVETQKAIELGVYANANYEVSHALTFSFGLRWSSYYYLGPHSVLKYANGFPKSTDTVTDTTYYSSNQLISQFNGLEPRAMARLTLSRSSSLKFSYNRIFQYIQVLSNTTTLSPTDTWRLSDPYIKPQIGDQLSIGFYKTLGESLDFSSEVYYKETNQAIDAKSGAVLFMNKHIETDVIPVKAKAYGIEFMFKKNVGKLTGWLSYTYSRSLMQSVSSFSAETINNGKYYPSNYDKPHAVNLVSNYKFTRRLSFSTTVTYSTGRPITLPLVKYQTDGQGHIYYSDRNQYRVPDYFRVDLSINLEGNHKIKKLAHSSWSLSVYNLTGRHNVYSVYFTNNNGQISGYQMSIFARPIPTLTYNFRF